MLENIEGYLNILRNKYLTDLINNTYIKDKFNKYKYVNKAYIGFDICDNQIENIKCYIGAKKDLCDKFNENYCSIMLNKSAQFNKKLCNAIFDKNNFSLTENSFSLLNNFNSDLITDRDVFIGRFKNLDDNKINNILDNLLIISGYSFAKESIQKCINIIKNENNTQKHPVYILGLNTSNNFFKINEIKVYYDLCKFKNIYDEFGNNDYNVAANAAKKILSMTNDVVLNEKYNNIIEHFKLKEAVLTMFCINYRNNTEDIHKIYFKEGNKPINDRPKFISDLHKIIFGDYMSEINKEILCSAINNGFNLAEMCIASNGKNLKLKIYFEFDNY